MLCIPVLARVLEGAPDAIVVSDADGAIVYANRAAEALFGPAAAQLSGNVITSLVRRGRDLAPAAALFEDAGGQALEAHRSELRAGQSVLTIVALRARNAHRPRQARIALQDPQHRDPQDAWIVATRALRAPLQILRLACAMLRQQLRAPEALEALGYQERALAAMSALVHALLDLGKLAAGMVEPQCSEFDVAELSAALHAEFVARAGAQGLALCFECDAGVLRSDRVLLEQLLRNLFLHALDCTHQGRIGLRCRFGTSGARLELSATADSALVSSLDASLAAARAGTEQSPMNGTGLELSIAQWIAHLLGHELTAQWDAVLGSCFGLTIPGRSSSPLGALQMPTRCDPRSAARSD